MLAYVLAFVVALSSLTIYIAAFFFPEIHRKNDFIWSGVGLFYSLVLWVFAPRITGGLFLGHIASVSLLVWFGWQTLSLRRQVTPQALQTPLPSSQTIKTGIQEQVSKFSLGDTITQLQQTISQILTGVKQKLTSKFPTTKPEDISAILADNPVVPTEKSEASTPLASDTVATDNAPQNQTLINQDH